MAKVSKAKMSKKVFKKSSEVTVNSTALKPEVVYDDDDDLKGADEEIISEEEDGEDERKRQHLLEAISALGGKRRKALGERSEAAVQMSEFMVNAEDESERVELSDLIQIIEKTSTVPAKTKKQLKNLQRSKTIECPLSKQESERIQRDVAFQKAATDISRWKSIISQNQRAEQLMFPLNQEPSGPKPMERVVTGWKAQTPLEQEIFALLSANKQPINDPILTPIEQASMRAMSLEEAKVRRAELQKARALQSYYEAQARREKKIKSKKFHKVQNKAKRKEFLKQFDEMVKTDPAAALEELNKMEVARMQERMSLKHQNSGKWAKSRAIMAKYNEGARKAMQQQLEVNKHLTQKLVTSLNGDDEEEEEAGDPELLPDFVNDAEQDLDSSNPWMRGRLSEDPTEEEANSDTVGLTTEQSGGMEYIAEEEEKVEETEDNVILREFDSRRKLRQALETDTAVEMSVDEEEEEESKAAAEDGYASDKEEERLCEFTNLFHEIVEGQSRVEGAGDAGRTDTSTQLEAEVIRIRTLGSVELLTQDNSATDKVHVESQKPLSTENLPSTTQKAGKSRKRKKKIQLKEVLTKETKVMKVLLAPTIEASEELEEKLDQRGLIKEAFAGDDVISEFLKDKRKQEDVGTSKILDLTLPGWGEWGGTGLKPSRSKRRRFRVKNAPPPPRKDQHLPSVIISEKRNSFISLHQVNSLPFPFENHTQFESTIRSPLGRTWNTERTVKKITKPKVVTQLGTIIEPMAQEELVKVKVSAGKNSCVDSLKIKY
ncbi:U3 small nucleolar RNA-associated protein 14 homolog A [Amphiprion ocellaris]|uniref:UTP14C small subunit processome component n=1 Tax=Amphiprion ocellaris TaxID=80972 RepID=A0A3Q1BTE0_AMPOC|nr:U3 small nucleolar RNA-associated protein 14 homolog A [Amphiprion ocellaris]